MTQAFNTSGCRPTTLLYHRPVINFSDLRGNRNYEDEEIWGSISVKKP